MNLGDLIELYRRDADDKKSPPFCSDEDLIEYANDAELEACRRARLILDSTTPALCRLSFTAAGSPVVRLDARVISVRRMVWPGRSLPLYSRLTGQMDEEFPGWETHTGQEPSLYVTDVQTQALRLYPIPTASGTLQLSVYRLPLAPMEGLEDEPEIQERARRGLVQWMLFMGLGKQDADSFNAGKSAAAYKLFSQEYGEAHSARNDAWIVNEMAVLPAPLV